MKNNTLVVITSALFIGSNGEILAAPSPYRLKRLHKTIAAITLHGFYEVVVLDNTFPTAFKLEDVEMAILGPITVTFLKNEFQINGPSRLEAILLAQSLADIQTRFAHFKFILKLSAGYEVKNLAAILTRANGGLVFRMGNPFRTKIKFCLTSFYIMPIAHFKAMCVFFTENLSDMCNEQPLEYYLYRYVQTVPHRFITVPYPSFDADFLSSGRSSTDLDYRLKEGVFKLIARLGFYAYKFK